MQKIEDANKKLKNVPFNLIIITIILIIIPIIFKIILFSISNEIDNLPEVEKTDQSGGAFIYALFYFFIATLGMWSLVINSVIIVIVWLIYFIKRKKSQKDSVNDCEK